MMRPTQVLSLIVAGLVVAGGGLWLVSHRGADSAADAEGKVLPLTQADLNAVTRLRIYKGDGSHTTLTRGATQWVVAEREYPADTGQVRKLLLDLASLQVEEQKTSDPALYSKLGVEAPKGFQATSTGLSIDLKGRTLELIVGHTSGTRSVYVRVPNQPQSLLVNPQLAPDADPRHWLDRAILDIPPDQVTEVDMKSQGGPEYSVKRAAAGAAPEYVVSPLPKGREPADAATMASQAGALAGLQLDDVRKATNAAAVAQATFRTSDGLTLAIAGIQQAEQRYITVVASAMTPATQARARDLNARLAGWEFEIPGYRYESLFRPLEQLLKPKPAPGAAQEGGKSGIPPGAPDAPPRLPFGPQSSGQDKVTPQQSH
jgi:Domain of unknown function (DUF4340)